MREAEADVTVDDGTLEPDFGTVLTQARQGPALVAPHQAGVADNVCSNDCRQFALLTRQRHLPG